MNLGWLRDRWPRRPVLKARRLPNRRGMVLFIAGAFVVGVGAGWGTTILAQSIASSPKASLDPSLAPSPSSTPAASEDPGVPVDQYPPIQRAMSGDDLFAGLSDLAIPLTGSGTWIFAPGMEPPTTDGTVTWVRIEIEDNLPLTPEPLAAFVLSVLNDERGWAAGTRFVFGGTEGAADVRVVFASPATAATICERPHDAVAPPIALHEEGTEPSLPTSPSPSTEVSTPPPAIPSCADQGIIVVNAYDWAAGLYVFGDERPSARSYLINHFMGHILEHPDATCPGTDTLAPVMLDHERPIAPCRPNAWPNPIASSDPITP